MLVRLYCFMDVEIPNKISCTNKNGVNMPQYWEKISKCLMPSQDKIQLRKFMFKIRFLENSALVDELLSSGAIIYVCGDASRMARDVQAAIAKIVAKSRDIHEDKAAELVKSWKVQNRYQEDVW